MASFSGVLASRIMPDNRYSQADSSTSKERSESPVDIDVVAETTSARFF